MFRILCFVITICFVNLYSTENLVKFEGLLGSANGSLPNFSSSLANYFIPFNPVVLEIGGFEGKNTMALAQAYPKGKVIVFEPNPRAYQQLLINIGKFDNVLSYNLALNIYNGMAELNICRGIYGDDPYFEKHSSLLEEFSENRMYFKGSTVDVPCVILDDWFQKSPFDHIDFVLLDLEGFELQVLKSSPNVVNSAIVIYTKTNFTEFRKEATQYFELKRFLEDSGFELLAHWYLEGLHGEAIFIKKYIYDALFR